MNRRKMLRLGSVAALVLALGACGQLEGIKQQFGLTKQSPDEFRVVSHAPLTLPPDFTLRPPEPGLPRPQEGTATERARKAIFRVDEPKIKSLDQTVAADGRSLGELSLLRSAGVDRADPKIRLLVGRETYAINAESDGFVERLIFWREKEIPGVIVNASEESRRLRENAALGKSVTSGETPTIKRKSKALFEGLF